MLQVSSYLEFVHFCINNKSPIPVVKDWKGLFTFMGEQALSGVGFQGVERMKSAGADVPKEVMLRWYVMSERIRERNRKMNKVVEEVFDMLEKDGLECCLLKGQGNNLMYPDPYVRTSGDIDVWVNANRERILSFAKAHFKLKTDVRYHHVECEYQGVPVELHVFPCTMNTPVYNHRLQELFRKSVHEQCQHRVLLPDGERKVPVATVTFNLVYQLSHLYHHFFDEGIGLRQMMDYFYVLKTAWKEDSFDRDVLVENLKNVNLYRFAQAVMWVLHEVFGLEQKFFIVPADVRRGRLLLDEILKGGNFGKYSGITNHSIGVKYFLKVKRNMRFVRTYPVEALFEPLFRTWHFFWRLSRR